MAKEDWFGRRLIAERFRQGRVFLCGDSAHIWVPYAGYGMNAGIADAADLAWLLAAHLNGWAPTAILDAYERERLPITDQVSRFAMDHAERMIRSRGAVPDDIEVDGPAATRRGRSFGQAMVELNVAQYCCAGLNFGYYYDDSPIIAYDGDAHPPYTMGAFTPSTVPGCRLPHVWLADGRSLYDALGAVLHAAAVRPDAERPGSRPPPGAGGPARRARPDRRHAATRRPPPARPRPAGPARRLAGRRRATPPRGSDSNLTGSTGCAW